MHGNVYFSDNFTVSYSHMMSNCSRHAQQYCLRDNCASGFMYTVVVYCFFVQYCNIYYFFLWNKMKRKIQKIVCTHSMDNYLYKVTFHLLKMTAVNKYNAMARLTAFINHCHELFLFQTIENAIAQIIKIIISLCSAQIK